MKATIPNIKYIEYARTLLYGMPTNCEVRVDKACAKALLIENASMNCDGYVFFFAIRDLGLGVCAISKADLRQRETKMIKKTP